MHKGILSATVILVMAVLLLSMMVTTTAAMPAASPGSNPAAATAAGATSAAAASPASTSSSPSPPTAPQEFYTTPTTGGGPHPGVLDGYEIAPSGMTSEDPASGYDTVSEEPMINIYQTLVAYNGSSSANFVPELSTCVPGGANGVSSTASVSCAARYGNSLITDNAQGEPQFYTFPIDPAAHFYDPTTDASWSVYPSDVMFSLARSNAFADLPGAAVDGDWIQAQAVLPAGSPTWDNAIHFPYNNTPENILGAMLVNDSTYCPAKAMSQSGCITFDAFGGGTDWPFFLQLFADPIGSAVVPCGWFTAQGAGIPGWSGPTAAHGDGPCLLPGGVTSTSEPGFQSYLAALTPTQWDSYEELAINHPATQPSVQFNLVGSGPYYIQLPMTPTTGYTLDASPAYQQPTSCLGVGGGCEPAAGGYIKKVVISYEPDDTVGIQQYVAGQADVAGISPPETSTMLQLQSEGKIGVLYTPSIASNFETWDLDFSVASEKTIDPTGGLNVPDNFLASNTVRELLTHANPYTTTLNSVFSIDGVHYGKNFGGAIPIGMGNYYPTNISWPYLGGDACSGTTQSTCNDTNNSALWWWQQGTTSSSPYYDAELAACSSSSPCKFPIIGELGDPSMDDAITNLVRGVETVTDGAVAPYLLDESLPTLIQYSSYAGGSNPLPDYYAAWYPDYPDPTDYMAAMYYANATFTLGNSVYQTLEANASYRAASCGHSSGSWADLVYWADLGMIPNDCQGPAYGAMLIWMSAAASLAPGAPRELDYNEVEQVENELSLYLWYYESEGVGTAAKWINNATVNTNVMIGGGGVQTYYNWGYTSAVANVYFNETGLGTTATSWSVQFAGQTYDNNVSSSTWQSIEIPAQTNGTYAWTINYVDSHTLAATNGSLKVVAPSSTGFTVAAAFSAYACTATCGTATFTEGGLESGTTWAVILQGLGSLTSNTSAIAFPSVTGSVTPYLYSVVPTVAYNTSTPANGVGSITVTAVTGGSASVFFTGLIFNTYSIVLNSGGLGSATGSWSVKLNGFNNTTALTGSSANLSIVFWEPIGTYPFTVYSTTGLTPISAVGQASVIGYNQPIAVPFTATPESLTFTETGLASGVGWGVTVAANDTNPHTAPGNSTYGGFTVPSTTTSAVFHVAQGTVKAPTVWNYSTIAVSGWAAPDSVGQAAVNDTPYGVTLAYALVTYPVTVYEVGLAAGATWSVNATYTYPGTSTTSFTAVTSSTSTLALNLPNGTSPYTVTAPAGYSVSSGSIIVSAAPVFLVLVIYLTPATFSVTFEETGVPSGSQWSVVVDGLQYNSTASTIPVGLTNGSHSYVVVVPSGYTASPSGGVLTVTGTTTTVSITVAPTKSNNGLSTLAYELIGLVVALAVIFLITTLYFVRRKPPTTAPPQSWEGTGTMTSPPGESGTGPSTPPPS
ncbi:MAG: hypothetical protein ACRECT_07720 [Thermoplasmata archaeon]